MYVVKWDQWYRCGRYGDDKEFVSMKEEFQTLCEANAFIDDLVEGKHRGFADMRVRREEVELTEKSS